MSKTELIQQISEDMQKLPMEDLRLVEITVYELLRYCKAPTTENE